MRHTITVFQRFNDQPWDIKHHILKHIIQTLSCVCILWSTALFATPEDDHKNAMESLLSGDLVTAMQLFRKAAEQDYAPAQVQLARILDRAEFNEEAMQWYRKAAEQNNAEAQFGLGLMHITGEAPEPDMEKALSLITAAAEQGLYKAIEMMVQAYRYGELGLSVNEEKAALWEEKLKKKTSSESTQ